MHAQIKEQKNVIPEIVDARFVSDKKVIVPGQPFLMGLHLKHKKGWHTYWQNPGDVGLAPMFNWELPVGWDVGDIQWQAPLVINMFEIKAWGFSGIEALHLVEVMPPNDLKPGERYNIGADITWMVCGKTCHPGTYRFDIAFEVGEKAVANPTWVTPFQDAIQRLPRPCRAWEARAKRQGEKVVLELRPAKTAEAASEIKSPYFFCSDGQVSSNNEQRVAPSRNGIIRLILPTAEYGPKDKPNLEGLVYADEGWRRDGTLKYMKVNVPYSRFGDP